MGTRQAAAELRMRAREHAASGNQLAAAVHYHLATRPFVDTDQRYFHECVDGGFEACNTAIAQAAPGSADAVLAHVLLLTQLANLACGWGSRSVDVNRHVGPAQRGLADSLIRLAATDESLGKLYTHTSCVGGPVSGPWSITVGMPESLPCGQLEQYADGAVAFGTPSAFGALVLEGNWIKAWEVVRSRQADYE